MIANAVKVWGSSFGAVRTLSRPGTIMKSRFSYRAAMDEITSTPTGPHTPSQGHMTPISQSQMPQKPSPVYLQSKDKKALYPDMKEEEIESEKIDYDPEATKSEIARRPMLLTHSFMMGLVIIMLFTVMAIIISKVNTGIFLGLITY